MTLKILSKKKYVHRQIHPMQSPTCWSFPTRTPHVPTHPPVWCAGGCAKNKNKKFSYISCTNTSACMVCMDKRQEVCMVPRCAHRRGVCSIKGVYGVCAGARARARQHTEFRFAALLQWPKSNPVSRYRHLEMAIF